MKTKIVLTLSLLVVAASASAECKLKTRSIETPLGNSPTVTIGCDVGEKIDSPTCSVAGDDGVTTHKLLSLRSARCQFYVSDLNETYPDRNIEVKLDDNGDPIDGYIPDYPSVTAQAFCCEEK